MTAQAHNLVINQIYRKSKFVWSTVRETESVILDGKPLFDSGRHVSAETSVKDGVVTVTLTFPITSYVVNTEVRED